MATAQMRVRGEGDSPGRRTIAALRLMEAERSEEILPILLDEIAALGYVRALAATVDLESSELVPSVSVNCSKPFQQRFRASLYAMENPFVQVLHSMKPQVVNGSRKNGPPIYCYPMLFRNRTSCWEADRARQPGCLAVINESRPVKIQLQEQVCSFCDMRGYAALVAVELPRTYTRTQLTNLNGLFEIGNRNLSRLYKTEHYFNRMSDMEVTIGQMQTVMQ